MCTLGRSIALKNEERGIIIGEERGIKIGEERAKRSAAIRLHQMKLPTVEIAFVVKESVETIRKWLEEAK